MAWVVVEAVLSIFSYFLTGLFYCVKYGIVNFVLHYIKYKNKRIETRK